MVSVIQTRVFPPIKSEGHIQIKNLKEGECPLKGLSRLSLLNERNGVMTDRNKKLLFLFFILLLKTHPAFAEATSMGDIESFLEQLGDFLITAVGPGILVIGIAISGVSMALGNEQGMRQGAIAAGGGALIMLSRAVLDLIQNVTHF